MKKSKVTLHPSYVVGDISPRLFGAFLEPIGSMVNGTMYNPKHPTADEQGFRSDVIEGLKKAGVPAVRLPGGNFVSGWRWKDSIGPKEERKQNLDLAWGQFIPNDVGHDEYLQWAEKIGAEAMYTINLGTGDLNDAIDIVEYTNFPGETYWSDLRIKNGHKDPYGVKVWYLGNEMDGPWQIASYEKDPKGYGILAHEVSKVMKFTDPSIETVACVSSCPFLSHYPDWDRKVLEECYESVDYISLHHYHSAPVGDIGALMAGVNAYEDYIRTEIALSDYMKTKYRSKHTMMISLDEYASSWREPKKASWGLNGRLPASTFYQFDPAKKFIHHDPDNMAAGGPPMLTGEVVSAVANASIGLLMLRHADRVKIGCATGGLSMYCASNHDNVWKGASYYTMTQLHEWAKGKSIMPVTETDTYHVDSYAIDDQNQYADIDNVPYVTAAAAYDEEKGELNVFVINGDWEEEHEFTMDIRGFGDFKLVENLVMADDGTMERNSHGNQTLHCPRLVNDAKFENGIVSTVLKKISWNVFRFEKAK